jgi:KAP family P-loop domain
MAKSASPSLLKIYWNKHVLISLLLSIIVVLYLTSPLSEPLKKPWIIFLQGRGPLVVVLLVFVLIVGFSEKIGSFLRRYQNSFSLGLIIPISLYVATTPFFTIGALFLYDFLWLPLEVPPEGVHWMCLGILGLWGTSIILFFHPLFIFVRRKKVDLPENQPVSGLLHQPIQSREEDRLGRSVFVDHFHVQISSLDRNGAHFILFDGAWGEGKTSVINLLMEKSGDNKVFVRFEPWRTLSVSDLRTSFYQALSNAFNKEIFYPQFSAKIAELLKVVSAGELHWFAKVVRGLTPSLYPSKASVEKVVSNILEKWDKQVVVIIDDLDRVTKEELWDVLKLVKELEGLKNCVFIFVGSKPHLKRLGEELRSEGGLTQHEDFLEKFIPFTISLPPVVNTALRKHLKDDISKFVTETFEALRAEDSTKVNAQKQELGSKELEEGYKELWRYEKIKTMRECVRFVDSFKFYLNPVFLEVSLSDFLTVHYFREFYPSTYNDLFRYRSHYVEEYIPGNDDNDMKHSVGMVSRSLSGNESKPDPVSLMTRNLGSIGDDERRSVEHLLGTLFKSRTVFPSSGQPPYSDDEGRLKHPQANDFYFRLTVDPSAILESEVREWAEELVWQSSAETLYCILIAKHHPEEQRPLDNWLSRLAEERNKEEWIWSRRDEWRKEFVLAVIIATLQSHKDDIANELDVYHAKANAILFCRESERISQLLPQSRPSWVPEVQWERVEALRNLPKATSQ